MTLAGMLQAHVCGRVEQANGDGGRMNEESVGSKVERRTA